MTPLSPAQTEATSPPITDADLVADLNRQLTRFLKSKPRAPLRIRIESADGSEESAAIPIHIVRSFLNVLEQQARGRGVRVLPIGIELTIEEAAEFLIVSQPFLGDLLDRGEIPHVEVGSERRVRLEELAKYRRINEEKRYEALEKMVALDQKFGFY